MLHVDCTSPNIHLATLTRRTSEDESTRFERSRVGFVWKLRQLARSDTYSLDVVLYEMLTGERPFRGARRMLFQQVLDDEPRPPRQLNEMVPRDLETINAYYSEEIVDHLNKEKVRVTDQYTSRDDAIPLPATLLIDACERISRDTSGMQVRLYSDHPWRPTDRPNSGEFGYCHRFLQDTRRHSD